MNYGHHGRDLLLELKRSDGSISTDDDDHLTYLAAYNDVTVAACLQDLKLHVTALSEQVEAAAQAADPSDSTTSKPSMAVRPSILLQNAAIQRNKRCLLAYHVERLKRIKLKYYWNQQQQQDAADSGQQQQQQQQTLCPAESDFLAAYSKLVQKYSESCDIQGDDLRAYQYPPVNVDRCMIRVMDDSPFDDGGPVVLESGQTVLLSAGSTHYLYFSDVEEYIRAGYMQLLEGEEG